MIFFPRWLFFGFLFEANIHTHTPTHTHTHTPTHTRTPIDHTHTRAHTHTNLDRFLCLFKHARKTRWMRMDACVGPAHEQALNRMLDCLRDIASHASTVLGSDKFLWRLAHASKQAKQLASWVTQQTNKQTNKQTTGMPSVTSMARRGSLPPSLPLLCARALSPPPPPLFFLSLAVPASPPPPLSRLSELA